MIMSKRETFYEDDLIKVSLEEDGGNLYAHLIFYVVSKKSVNWAKEIFEALKAKCYWAGYEYIYSYTQDGRIPELIPGWEHVGAVEDEYENLWGVFRWELK